MAAGRTRATRIARLRRIYADFAPVSSTKIRAIRTIREIRVIRTHIMIQKHILLTCSIFLTCSYLSAQGIQFVPGSWQQVLAQARAEHKLIFMDAYTTWCGPCKMMAAKTFTDSAVAAYYNAQFVNVKMDMEAGEGPMLAQRYEVQYFPSLLFFNADGTVAHKAVGYHQPAEFITLGRRAADTSANLLALHTRYELGDRTPDLLLAFIEAKAAAYDLSASQLANEYFKTQADLSTPKNMDAVFKFTADPYSDGFKFLMKNRAAFEAQQGAEQVEQKIDAVFEEYLRSHPNLQLGDVQRLYGTCYPEQGERLASNYRLVYYQQRNDTANFARAATDHYTRFPTADADELNEIAQMFAQNVTEPAMLQQAVQWATQSIAGHETADNQTTLATLQLKLGKKKAAAKAVRRAIVLAKAAGEDDSSLQELLLKTRQ